MILKALYDYYNRCGNLPIPGMEEKEIGFIIVLSKEGRFVRFEDCRTGKNQARTYLVKKHVGRSSAIVANYLYDNSTYVLGYADMDKEVDKYKEQVVLLEKEADQSVADQRAYEEAKEELQELEKKRSVKEQGCLDAFKKKLTSILESYPNSYELSAICKFYQQDKDKMLSSIEQDSLWEDIKKNLSKKYSTFSFRIEGDLKIVAEKREILQLDESEDTNEDKDICLITGDRGVAVDTTTATMIPGSQATAKLVAFQVNSGYDSYGKKKCGNAPISKEAEFAYTTALNAMLQKGSHNKFGVGNRTFVFWASSNNEAAEQTEDSLFDLLGYTEEEVDDPNAKIEQVRKVFTAIYSGSLKTSLEDRFYILGLAPNSARIAVVYWSECSLKEFAEKILRHFDDMEIIDTRKERKPYMGIKSMLAAVTLNGKQSEATPNLPETVVKSIFQGTPYPFTLFSACIRRIRAESGNKDNNAIRIARMAIIKAYLNRINDNNKKIDTMLDKSNTNQGYLCGRLFAVLENLQYAANKQDSIRSGYMNAASSTPSAVYPTILKLSNSHYSKLAKDKKGLAMYFDNQKKEIMTQISDFPDTLDLSDQGRFFLGYYHQKNHEENKETKD
ncbi:type I-C CRISPR-associated protein Cas8c/Csd1 [uncultured Prevotella sp.]|uniref:type I-C CRISPR-associated protein Cas8c/Csd1 n=1 Tax=uncultured Prevotella sp. TaxID=159272 RepID=UPI00262E8FAD|nr:type I-C CRISPR-associated protein Cas8c/Csd1 [uncultured Prevotella sp.]